ncbi:MAG: MBL fold metallo-hydrolase RNA specificity domain-containing protein [Nitrososphaerales archaeon]
MSELSKQVEGISISARNGIEIQSSSFSIALDPKRASNCDYTFVSHAHIDHVHVPNGKSKLIASEETKILAKLRGYDLGSISDRSSGVYLVDSGHILGAKAVVVKDRILYTGDICSRDRGFLKGFKGIKCETLIMETTYGRPHYIFPSIDEIASKVNRFIARCFDECRPVVLTGYPLGKAQVISYLFGSWDPIYLHESVYSMNQCHIDLGVGLRNLASYELTKSFDSKLTKGPWVLIAPNFSSKSNFISSLKRDYNAAVASFSGWALDSRFRFMQNATESFPLSDHSDFNELVEFAKYCNPSMVYTVHGFAKEFATYLRSIGFEAEPLGESLAQSRLTNFVH